DSLPLPGPPLRPPGRRLALRLGGALGRSPPPRLGPLRRLLEERQAVHSERPRRVSPISFVRHGSGRITRGSHQRRSAQAAGGDRRAPARPRGEAIGGRSLPRGGRAAGGRVSKQRTYCKMTSRNHRLVAGRSSTPPGAARSTTPRTALPEQEQDREDTNPGEE